MESPASLWSVAVALGSALLGVLVFMQTGLGVFKLRLEIQKLRDERKSPAQDSRSKKPNTPARKSRPAEQKVYRGAILRWVLVAIFLVLTVLSYLYLRAQEVVRQRAEMVQKEAEMAADNAAFQSYTAHTLQKENTALAKELAEARAILQRNNIPFPTPSE